MDDHELVTREAWTAARTALLAEEKALVRQADAIAAQRRALPWVLVEKDYVFDGPDGRQSLAALFAGRRQLVVYHFMYGPDWKQGCHRCSFWADNFDGIDVHLAHRDTTFLAASKPRSRTSRRTATPQGRNEGDAFDPMFWLRRHDQYKETDHDKLYQL